MNAVNDRAVWLKAGDSTCSSMPEALANAYRLVLLGAPGVGKGTQAELLSKGLGSCHLSTGDVFRAAKSNSSGNLSPAMTNAVDAMRKGELVSDSTVLTMIRERVRCLQCVAGFLLDGFPRTVAQAEELELILQSENVPLHAVISYTLPINTIVERLGGRRTCQSCKAVYHIATKPTAVSGLCDACGGKVIQRDDDRPDAIRVRMEAYEANTAPLIEFYRKRNLLVEVPADGTPEQIYRRSLLALSGLS